jgi:hypothetical protein
MIAFFDSFRVKASSTASRPSHAYAERSRHLDPRFRILGLRRFLFLMGLISAAMLGSSEAGAVCAHSIQDGKWCPASPGTSIPYYIGPGIVNCPIIEIAVCIQIETAIHAVMDEWENHALTHLGPGVLSFVFAGPTSGDPADFAPFPSLKKIDGAILFMREAFPVAVSVLGYEAFTPSFPVTATAAPLGQRNWSTVVLDRFGAGIVDLETLLRHEVGHALGIGHAQCTGRLMSEVLDNTPRTFDSELNETLVCLYSDSAVCEEIFGVSIESLTIPNGVVDITKGSCNCTNACFSSPAAAPARVGTEALGSSLRSYELAVSEDGGAYEVFAVLSDADWTNNQYSHVFTTSYTSASVRLRVFDELDEQIGEAYTTYLIEITGAPLAVPSMTPLATILISLVLVSSVLLAAGRALPRIWPPVE